MLIPVLSEKRDYGAELRRYSTHPSYLETMMGGDIETNKSDGTSIIPGSEKVRTGGIYQQRTGPECFSNSFEYGDG